MDNLCTTFTLGASTTARKRCGKRAGGTSSSESEPRPTRGEAYRPLFLEEPAGAVARSSVLGIAHRQEERIRSEKFVFGVETRFPPLPLV
jgi:hypothetical protein